MKILLEDLPHQEESIKAILDNFPGIDNDSSDSNMYSNPLIRGRFEEKTNIDVKMETGTGKTYVYTRLILELHKQFGLFKYVIVVPTPAIKEGTKNFINSNYAKQHFSQFYENTRIELNVINAGDFKAKSGRKNFPAQLLNFIEGSRQNTHTIQVLLINAGMLNSTSMSKDDYDQTFIGGLSSPIKAIQSTYPIVIIDEPHKFPRDKVNYRAVESLYPQMIVRFGATFPEIAIGSGKNKIVRKDYYRGNPQFELNAVESFNGGLVKGIDIYYPNLTENQAENRYIVDSVSSKELILKQNNKKWTLKIGDNLADVDSGFEGNVEFAGAKALSNELELEKGMELIPGTFNSSYQELIIKDAIEKHFEIEQENFLRRNHRENNDPKIKTLSLFFIDSIASYREKDGWLKSTFEKLLKLKISKLVAEYQLKLLPREKEYLDFLKATQESLSMDNQNVHAGYFSEDRGSGDQAIQDEVDDILKNKEKLLSFKDENDYWETRRFLFSKWTLREGWDNPNVFVIAKLRTSGSENSKLQEVGRGLRLPVDETGHRVQQEEWPSRLGFLIGYDEKDFASILVGEINNDVKVLLNQVKLTDDMIKLIVQERQKNDSSFTDERLLEHLDSFGIINRKNEFRSNVSIDNEVKNGFDWVIQLYPELNSNRLREDRIRDTRNILTKTRVKLNQDNWNSVKGIWREFSKRYMIEFERIPNTIESIAEAVIGDENLYVRDTPTRKHEAVVSSIDQNQVSLVSQDSPFDYKNYRLGIGYGKFIKGLTLGTGIPIKVIHPILFKLLKHTFSGNTDYLSEGSLNNLIREFKSRFDNAFSQAYKYQSLNFQARTSIFNPDTEKFVDDINAELIGVYSDKNIQYDKRYLYQLPPLYYDSVNPEKELLSYKYPANVVVFGKIPKSAIQVPKYTGGTTTPDFIYVINREKNSSIYLLVETKAENMRINDLRILDIQKKFFSLLNDYDIEYSEATQPKDVYNLIQKITEREDK